MLLPRLVGNICLTSAFLAGAVSAGPVQSDLSFGQIYRDAMHRHRATWRTSSAMNRWHRQTKKAVSETKVNQTAFAPTRYLNAKTSSFQVTALPSVPYDLGELYSGLMPIKAGDSSRELFFIFQPKLGEPSDTLTIWLNGGPGCSSLNGFLEENGRFVWRPGSDTPTENMEAWNGLTNMLWVEHPMGVGFNKGKVTASTEEEVSLEFISFFKNFQDTFGIKNYKIYVTGESYAGRYVPYISSAMIDAVAANPSSVAYYDLRGALIYDGVIGAYKSVQQDMTVVPYMQAHPADFANIPASTRSSLESAHKSCGFDTFISNYKTFPPPGVQPPVTSSYNCNLFNQAYQASLSANPCFNVYLTTQTCPSPADPLQPDSGTAYFNRDDVKAALHAPANTAWDICTSQSVFLGRGAGRDGDLSLDPIQSVLPKVLEKTNRVLVANGDLDMVIITDGSLLAIQNMTWGGQLGFQTKPSTPINIPNQGNKGIQHVERGLMWTEIFQSGHMGPQHDATVAYRQLQWVLGQIESL